IVPVNGKYINDISLKNKSVGKSEEYYKWQFIYALIHSGLYSKDYIGVEIYFPKGNKNAAPIKMDSCIFDSKDWIYYYEKWSNNKNQNSLEWLRNHVVAVIEFKKEDNKTTEDNFNSQIKAYLKEPEPLDRYVLAFYYDFERLYIFQRNKGKILRYNERYNAKGENSGTKDLSLNLTDNYNNIPSFNELIQKINKPQKMDPSKRTISNLDLISDLHSNQVNDAMSNILRAMDKAGLVNQRGYQILIQILALKIFDEQQSKKYDNYYLKFYITDDEIQYNNLSEPKIQKFISRLKNINNDAAGNYNEILQDLEINWKDSSHIKVITTVIDNFQNYSFVRSAKSELWQLVFYRFANEFSKGEKGQFVTPLQLIDFLVQIVNPRNGETVIDPTVGIADFLSLSYINSKSQLDDRNIYGIDNDQHMIMLARLNMLLNGDGEAKLLYYPDKGTIVAKIDQSGALVELNPNLHKNGNWDSWKDKTKLKKFDVVLTNPPFGEDRKYEPKTPLDREIIEMYELWNIARCGNWIDMGLVFLENAYHILDEEGRIGIVLSNSIASIDRWEKARKWLIEKMRIVALFDLPANVFADTGVNTTLLVAYKPKLKELEKLNKDGYEVFVKDIQKIGYEIRT
ncbi:MAG: N-6 DNA methylase, partial [Elusimicrobiota bacterium]